MEAEKHQSEPNLAGLEKISKSFAHIVGITNQLMHRLTYVYVQQKNSDTETGKQSWSDVLSYFVSHLDQVELNPASLSKFDFDSKERMDEVPKPRMPEKTQEKIKTEIESLTKYGFTELDNSDDLIDDVSIVQLQMLHFVAAMNRVQTLVGFSAELGKIVIPEENLKQVLSDLNQCNLANISRGTTILEVFYKLFYTSMTEEQKYAFNFYRNDLLNAKRV